MGCPKPGYYGHTCAIPCPDAFCQFCHIEKGTCKTCNPGNQGDHCESGINSMDLFLIIIKKRDK